MVLFWGAQEIRDHGGIYVSGQDPPPPFFQSKCKKTRVQKWLQETEKERLRRHQVKTTDKRGKGVNEQQ